MEVGGLDLLGGTGTGGGGGGGISLGGSTNGSLTTELVEQDYVGLSSEASSYTEELDLGLGLSLGNCGVKANNNNNNNHNKPTSWGEYGRILTAIDFPSMGSSSSTAAASSSSSSSGNKTSINPSLTTKTPVSGTKRAADSITQEGGSPNAGVSSQVVGWPPIRTYRINSLVNQNKNSSVEEDKMVIENCKNKEITKKNTDDRKNNGTVLKKDHLGKSQFVKVNMDGVPIGRKVDLNSHACYETLAQTLEDMFYRPTTNFIRSSEEKEYGAEAKKASKLLGGSSEFVLTYEDKDGDWMLVGDVPWGMFLNTVKRLRIMRASEANGLAPRYDGNNDRQRNKPI
ncbi:hypothetical protein AQUCO_03400256v1 [Aquilegia coerulea]|uniref:Auxin-responsive protein n=1 Tax=Aquilegia coerulea TaxID=218851 RepID=A0A2G5CY51_AQUCA|nr:hypothetical protein AQUCO_03400256v1 [Aquilegia coerulea]